MRRLFAKIRVNECNGDVSTARRGASITANYKLVKMKRIHWLIAAACLVHAVAWFLPVIKEGVTLPHGLPGWQAFRVAASPVWPYEGFRFEPGYNAVLAAMSALTTAVFVLGSAWILALRSRNLHRLCAWIATCAFIVNAHWVLRFGGDRLNLRIGFFLWWTSFLLMAIGLFRLSRATASS